MQPNLQQASSMNFAIPHIWEVLDRTWQYQQQNLLKNHQTYARGLLTGKDNLPKHFQ
jgi:hypothetical protein